MFCKECKMSVRYCCCGNNKVNFVKKLWNKIFPKRPRPLTYVERLELEITEALNNMTAEDMGRCHKCGGYLNFEGECNCFLTEENTMLADSAEAAQTLANERAANIISNPHGTFED